MKKLTKTILSLIAVCGFFIALQSCQEDVYPDLQDPEVVQADGIDATGETEDEEEETGMDPK